MSSSVLSSLLSYNLKLDSWHTANLCSHDTGYAKIIQRTSDKSTGQRQKLNKCENDHLLEIPL